MQDYLYVASIIYEVNLSKSGKQLIEEQLILLSALNKEEARMKATEIANSNSGVEETLYEGYQIWKYKSIQYIVRVENHLNKEPFITRTIKSITCQDRKNPLIPQVQLN